MLETIGVVLRLVVEVLSTVLRPAAELLDTVARSLFDAAPAAHAEAGALVLAVAVVAALALLCVAIAVFRTPAGSVDAAPHPRRAIADATRLSASHPDAPGHSRPRAPGSAALAA